MSIRHRRGEHRDASEMELKELLLEAEEILRELEVPSGNWTQESDMKPATPSEPMPRLEGSAWRDIDPETAFWLLFPPRGNA